MPNETNSTADASLLPADSSAVAGSIATRMASLIDQPSTANADSQEQRDASSASCFQLLKQLWHDSQVTPKAQQELGGGGGDDMKPLSAMPRRLGRFELRALLGTGGFGIVYRAYDPKLDRDVALKLPRPEVLFSDPLRERFLREAHVAAVLDHPGIVPVFETGGDWPAWFIVTALCQGKTLAAWLNVLQAKVDERLAAELVAQLAEATHHAHTHGVLHRDLKPSNVLLEPLSEDSASVLPFVPRITDFGLAKRIDEESVHSANGDLLGTLAYMAPEQVSGRQSEITVPTDVYALGAILYEVLTGRPPLQGANQSETRRLIEDVDPAPIRSVRRKVSRDLEAICQKCLAKRPADRYSTALDLAKDLRRMLASEPTRARPLRTHQRVGRWCIRRPVVSGLLATLLLSIVCGIAGIFSQWRRAEQNFATAEAEAKVAEQRLKEVQQFLVNFGWVLDESNFWPGSYLHSEPRQHLIEYFQQILGECDAEHAPKPLVAILEFNAGHRAHEKADYDAARDHYQQSIRLWRELLSDDPLNFHFRRALAQTLYSYSTGSAPGDAAAARLAPFDGTGLFGQFSPTSDNDRVYIQDYANLLAERSRSLRATSDGRQALPAMEAALDCFLRLIAAAPQNMQFRFSAGLAGRWIAEIRLCNGEQRAALGACKIAKSHLDFLLREQPSWTEARMHLGAVWHLTGRAHRERRTEERARQAFYKACGFLSDALDANPQDDVCRDELAATYCDLAYAKLQEGREDSALDIFRQAHNVWWPIFLEHRMQSATMQRLALVCRQIGRLSSRAAPTDEAVTLYDQGVKVCESIAAGSRTRDSETTRAECLEHLASLRLQRKEPELAADAWRKSADVYLRIAERYGNDEEFRRRAELCKQRARSVLDEAVAKVGSGEVGSE